jgi:prepilin-type processing-associated H-X9-DG protein
MRHKSWTIIDLLVITAVVAGLSSILFPVFQQSALAQRKSNEFNLKRILKAASHYAQDYDDSVPVLSNGRYRDLKNMRDGQLSEYGEQRTDLWPLILLPYIKDRSTFVDPQRGDTFGIYAASPLATSDSGYNPLANTYRNQNRFPMFAVNDLFLSPMIIPASKIYESSPTDFMQGTSHMFSEADDQANTVFYAESQRGSVPQSVDDVVGQLDTARGFFGIDAPGLWEQLVVGNDLTLPVIFWTGTNCSGDWCGDADPNEPDLQPTTNTFYESVPTQGNNVGFMDGHVSFRTVLGLMAGTDYLTSTPQDGGSGAFGGGANITNKSLYLWNLNDNYYGG